MLCSVDARTWTIRIHSNVSELSTTHCLTPTHPAPPLTPAGLAFWFSYSWFKTAGRESGCGWRIVIEKAVAERKQTEREHRSISVLLSEKGEELKKINTKKKGIKIGIQRKILLNYNVAAVQFYLVISFMCT